jgi:23S rRNA (uracil1939-C5)-methyltransferase
MAETVEIARIGHRGDGIAETGGGPVYVPFTLPGETVRIERDGERGRLIAVEKASPERTDPICRHFGTCGGCALQMLSPDGNRTLKRRFVADALAGRGIDAGVDETVGIEPGSRRRAILAARTVRGRTLLGYHERQSNRIVDIAECPVLVPQIAGQLESIREIAGSILPAGRPARITILATETGLDVDLAGARPPDAGTKRRERLVALCRRAAIARLTIAGEIAVQLAEPRLPVAGVALRPQPAAFAQAAAAAQEAIADLVAGHLAACGHVADLFSGFGTFSLAFARFARVHAVEADAAALAALDDAVRHASGLKPVTTERRDIMRFPLTARELAAYDGVVFDPPRAGAKEQAAELAASGVGTVAAVSCSPATFARDARILIDGGFRLERVVPVDQFVFSAETEIVGLFAR